MKNKINGKLYNTEKAVKCAYWDNNIPRGNFESISETLFKRKIGGEYFLEGCGGAFTKYAITLEDGWESGSCKIIPLTDEDTLKWLSEKCAVNGEFKLYESFYDDNVKEWLKDNLSTDEYDLLDKYVQR